MATIGFPVQPNFRGAWIIKPDPIIYQNGLGSLGYQGISDNSIARIFGKEKKGKKGKSRKRKGESRKRKGESRKRKGESRKKKN